ncbi:MAG: hypothetical protein O9301_07295 [Leptospira sp.]|nr:hypothetical protein [Leptospira sp.]
MAKNKSLFKRIFFFWKKSGEGELTRKLPKKQPKDFTSEWEISRDTFQKKLPTKRMKVGESLTQGKIRITKTNEKLFRLEGNEFSLMILTGNHLFKTKDGKWGGVLYLEEGELNLNLKKEISDLESFISRLSIPKTDLHIDSNETVGDWREILNWERFWKEQLLLQISPNAMALAILALGEECRIFFESVATKRQRDLVRDEFFYLNLGADELGNPHSKVKNLYGFSSAIQEFGTKIQLIGERRKKENGL